MINKRSTLNMIGILIFAGVAFVGCESCISRGAQPRTAADIAEAVAEAPNDTAAPDESKTR